MGSVTSGWNGRPLSYRYDTWYPGAPGGLTGGAHRGLTGLMQNSLNPTQALYRISSLLSLLLHFLSSPEKPPKIYLPPQKTKSSRTYLACIMKQTSWNN